MKLTDEEIRRGYIGSTKEAVHPESFVEGARFAESHYVPLIEANEWLIIDTEEKRKAYPFQIGDEYWTENSGEWVKGAGGIGVGGFGRNSLYRRHIKWRAVSDTPIPKGVPVWLKFEHCERPLVHSPGGIMSHPDWGPLTHWRYASIPAPPIDPEREAFEKWYVSQKVVLPSFQDAAHKECCWQIWQAARSRKQE